MSKKELQQMIDWIEARIHFVDKLIADARNTCNYGKEMHFCAQREVYNEMLEKLRASGQ